jgi:hypothetical protein
MPQPLLYRIVSSTESVVRVLVKRVWIEQEVYRIVLPVQQLELKLKGDVGRNGTAAAMEALLIAHRPECLRPTDPQQQREL